MDIVDKAYEVEQLHLRKALAALSDTRSNRATASECEECGDPIPLERQEAAPGTQRCIECAD